MKTELVPRPGRWSLPPTPPESWLGGNASLAVVVAGGAALGFPGLLLVPRAAASTVGLALAYGIGGLLALGCTYLLVVQASVAQDARLRWLAAGFALLLVVDLVRSAAGTGHAATQALALSWVAVLPWVALTSRFWRWSRVALLLPVVLALASACLAPTLFGSRVAAVLATCVAGAAAIRWLGGLSQSTRGARLWVGVTLLVVTLVGVVRSLRFDSALALVLEDLALLVPCAGLYALTARGYTKQSRLWRDLEAQAKVLRSSSGLLPGLSSTPAELADLPGRRDVSDLIARAELRIALQPVVDLSCGQMVGSEALSRFASRVPTERWFRSAALHGLGPELERLTMGAALATLELVPAGQFLAVNVSPASLHDGEVLRLLHASDLARIMVEVTEHDAINDYGDTRRSLASLRAAGARIAVDDVGAGFASLRHVLLLQPDLIKLDNSLTREVHLNPRQQAIVHSLVAFAAEVGAVVLAEGIELAEQVPALLEAGVSWGQGWHLGLPVTAEPPYQG